MVVRPGRAAELHVRRPGDLVAERRKLGPEALIRILAGELLRVEEEAVKAKRLMRHVTFRGHGPPTRPGSAKGSSWS